MKNILRSVGVIIALSCVTATLLTGCTPENESSTADSSASATVSPASSAQIFASQSKTLEEERPDAQAAFTKTGSGPDAIDVPALPEGKKRIGIVINCDSDSDWKINIAQKTPANATAKCMVDIVQAADFPIDSPKEATKLDLDLPPVTTYWLTVYYL